jgi:hypothetical protein
MVGVFPLVFRSARHDREKARHARDPTALAKAGSWDRLSVFVTPFDFCRTAALAPFAKEVAETLDFLPAVPVQLGVAARICLRLLQL